VQQLDYFYSLLSRLGLGFGSYLVIRPLTAFIARLVFKQQTWDSLAAVRHYSLDSSLGAFSEFLVRVAVTDSANSLRTATIAFRYF
jgi:hypothetical protein